MIGVHGTPYFVLMYPDQENQARTTITSSRRLPGAAGAGHVIAGAAPQLSRPDHQAGGQQPAAAQPP
jgi:hypothetical protein